MGDEAENQVNSDLAPRGPPKESWSTFFCNTEKKSCCGRTGGSWAKIILFYITFYACLAGFMIGCMVGLMSTLQDDRPKWSLETETNILKLPGMKSIPPNLTTVRMAVPELRFSISDDSSYSDYVSKIDKLLNVYRENSTLETKDTCGKDSTHSCQHSLALLGNCSGSDVNYGYNIGEPCIALRINKVHNWKPDLFSSNPDSELISDFSGTSIPLTCEEQKEFGGSFKLTPGKPHFVFYPSTGFPVTCFPFCSHLKTKSLWLSPVVMVKLLDFPKDTDITIWCKMYLPSVKKYYSRDANAAVRFTVNIKN